MAMTEAGAVSLDVTQRLLSRGSSARLARIGTRSRLTMLHWEGDVEGAAHVVGILVDNAVRHVEVVRQGFEPPLLLRLAFIEKGALLIDVTDSQRSFEKFDAALAGDLGERGLWRARHDYGAELHWFRTRDGTGKAVRALIGVRGERPRRHWRSPK